MRQVLNIINRKRFLQNIQFLGICSISYLPNIYRMQIIRKKAVHTVFNEEQELQHEFGFSTIHFTMEVMASYDLHDLYFNKMNDQIKESPSAQLHIIFTHI